MSTQAPQHDNRQLHLMLKKNYPSVFRKPFKPLAIGIHNTLHERHGEHYSLESIRHYLHGFTKSHFYNAEILKCQEGDPRYNLEGEREGEITLKGLRHAAKMYLNRWGRIEEPNLKDQMLKKRAEDLLGRKSAAPDIAE